MGSSLISWSRFLCLYLEIITGSPSRQWALPPRLSPSPPCTACISRLFRDATLLRVCDGQENRWRSPYARMLCSHGVPTKSIRFPHSAAVESPAALFGFYSVCNYSSPEDFYLAFVPPLHGDAWPHRAVFSFYRQENTQGMPRLIRGLRRV